MPIYEYHCGKCGDFEVMQKMSDKPLSICPTCRRKVTKLISSTSFQLKGSGWYVTDYARKGGAGVTKSEDKKSDTSGSSDGSSKASGETASSGESSKSGGGESPSKSSGESKKSSGGKASSEKAAAA